MDENSNRYNVHLLLPKRKEDDSRICYHIASKETIWVPIDYWTDVDWNETTLISSEGNIPICINKVNDNEEKGTIWKMDFFEFSMKQEEFKLVVPSCDAKKIIYQCFLSSVEDAYTQYIGDMTIADNERILPWKSTIFSTVVEFDYKTIVVLKENEEGEECLIVGNLGSSINVYGYNISADTDGLLISGAASADMTYCELTAKSGIKITVMQDISPVAGDTQKNKYNLNFKDYGITQDDVLSGMIQFNTSTTTWKELCEKQQSKLDSEGAIPFSDADQRLLRRVGALK